MPPLDWSMVQSGLLCLVLPGFGIAAIVMAISALGIRSERQRVTAASIALMAAMLVGNWLRDLVPLLEFDTGWRSLVWVTLAAALSEAIMVNAFRGTTPSRWISCIIIVSAILFSAAITPWDFAIAPLHIKVARPGECGLLALIIVLDWTTFNFLCQQKYGDFVASCVATLWGGFAAAVLVLAHSARFADLAILLSCIVSGIGTVCMLTRQRPNHFFAGPSVLIPGLMLVGALDTYSNVPLASFALVAVSPGFLALLHWKKLAAWSETHIKTLLLISSIPGLIAVGLAIRAEM